MNCKIHTDKPAYAIVTWGLYEHDGKKRTIPMQKAPLCQDCINELWDKCHAAVNLGSMHWTQELPTK